MTEQELLDFLAKHQEAEELMLRGMNHFYNGNLEAALVACEASLTINPKSIPALLSHSLCCFAMIRGKTASDIQGITHLESRKYIRDMISSLETATNLMKEINLRLETF